MNQLSIECTCRLLTNMSENTEELEQSLQLYETQLHQINDAIANNNDNLDELRSLQSNLTELISLTKESLESTKLQKINDSDPLAQEYELFKAELQKEITTEKATAGPDDSIEDELDELIGTKCQAPYAEQWAHSSATYHNALIMSIDADKSLDNVKAKVMFVNPTCREMVPCQYYLNGECKFTDDQCHFSHGYVVYFSDLREYKEPDFSSLKENVTVLAKDEDELWKRALVTAMLPDTNQCSVKFELGRKKEIIVDIHHTLPLIMEDDGNKYCALEGQEIEHFEDSSNRDLETQIMIEKSLTQEPPLNKLGEWEKYTTGIGSKLMASMGYVVGTGLGRHGEGRVEPVVAVALPPGKSLDHCMALREKAGGDPNLFRVDKLQKKLKRRSKNTNPVANVTPKKSSDVFAFINGALAGTSSKRGTEPQDEPSRLKTATSQALNVEELKINENIDKKKYELMVLKERLSRQKQNTIGQSTLLKQVRGVEKEIHTMHTSLKNLHKEKNYRKTMKELTEF